MQQQQSFIFAPGIWIGEGKITFTASPEVLSFFTKWESKPGVRENEIQCTQQVEMQGVDDKVVNRFRFFDITPKTFAIELENDLVGVVRGKGIISATELAWEFRGHPSFEGFEVYRLKDSGDYNVHAEFASPDQFRTIIDGRVWKKTDDEADKTEK
ncbi:MAG: hypothetical protein Q8K75_03955 [Chlamydiales bacterium]|nr:hypothetical protein [Chlamydiales bacterium]